MDDWILPIKAQQWQEWFEKPIPMLEDMTPREAAQTHRGRNLLNDLFAFYDQMRDRAITNDASDNLSLNVPTAYAKWKLGIGPGSAEQFATEEAIYNYSSDSKVTQRTPKQSARLEKKKSQKCFFIPLRCEVHGCSKTGRDTISMRCARCECVYYCGKDHQVQDWPRHKQECKYLKKCGLKPRSYDTSEELEKYPIGCFPLVDTPRSSSSKSSSVICFVCGATSEQADIGFTDCCNLPVCDNEHEYQLMSYSRDFCKRSHRSYTACSYHHHNEHSGNDWRTCSECNEMEVHHVQGNGPDILVRPFSLTNRFNVTPALESQLPQGSFLTQPCDNPGCKNRIFPGFDALSHKPDGTVVCGNCS